MENKNNEGIDKMEKNEIIEVKLFITQLTTKDGKAFNAYHTYDEKGKKLKVKFRKEVTNIPSKDGIIYCDIDEISYQNNTQYPALWIHEILNYTDNQTDFNKNRDKIRQLLGK